MITKRKEPFIIAEAGVNYYDISRQMKIEPIEAAKLMILECKKHRIDAIKFQSYKAETLTSTYAPAYWNIKKEKITNQYQLFKKYDSFDEPEYKELYLYSKQKQIVFLSTPFDYSSADYLFSMMPAYKISSSDITNIPFIQYIAEKGKPILLSTGASNISEIKIATNTICKTGNNRIILMHCILNYPTLYKNANLSMIRGIKKEFPEYVIGYSDHTVPDKKMLVLLTAWLHGAIVIEKHFTLNKSLPGNDHYHSMDPSDIDSLRKNIEFVQKCNGQEQKNILPSEKRARKFARRSIVINRPLSKGNIITLDAISFKRPGTGISPSKIGQVIGKKIKRDIPYDHILKINDLIENKK